MNKIIALAITAFVAAFSAESAMATHGGPHIYTYKCEIAVKVYASKIVDGIWKVVNVTDHVFTDAAVPGERECVTIGGLGSLAFQQSCTFAKRVYGNFHAEPGRFKLTASHSLLISSGEKKTYNGVTKACP